MKKILVVLMLLSPCAWAQTIAPPSSALPAPTPSAPTVDQSALQLLRDKLKETRPAVLITPYVAPAYLALLPVWVFHSVYESGQVDASRDIFEIVVGGRYEMDTHDKQAFIGADFNLVALSSRLWSFPWAQSHVRRSKFPPIFAGPAAMVPLEYGEYRQNNIGELLKRNLRFMVSATMGF